MSKQLYRSRRNRMISGVAGGIAEYFDIDPVIIRAIFIITTLGWGFSIVVYVVLWLIVPDEIRLKKYENPYQYKDPNNTSEKAQNASFHFENSKQSKSDKKVLIGIIMIVLGIAFLINNITSISVIGHLWPLALVVIGFYILFKNNKSNGFQEAG